MYQLEDEACIGFKVRDIVVKVIEVNSNNKESLELFKKTLSL